MASQQQQQQRRRRHSSCDLTDLPSEAEENVTRTLGGGGGGGEPRTAVTKAAAAADAETAAVDFKPQSVPPTKKLDEVVREDRSLFDFLSF